MHALTRELVDILCLPHIPVGAVASVVSVDAFREVFPGAPTGRKHNEKVTL